MRQSFDTMRLGIIGAVSEREGRDPGTLPPLPDEVDPATLTRLFDYSSGQRGDFYAVVTFPYAGYRVTVRHDGEISLSPTDRPGPPGQN